MSDIPILYNAAMVRAVSDLSKTQTRRPVEWTGMDDIDDDGWPVYEDKYGDFQRQRSPFGKVGDTLFVRECCRAEEHGVRYRADNALVEIDNTQLASDRWGDMWTYRGGEGLWLPGMHQPRWASRVSLERRVTAIRIERVQDITFDDCVAEGIPRLPGADAEFRVLWNSIYGKQKPNKPDLSWEANSYVWVGQFEVIK